MPVLDTNAARENIVALIDHENMMQNQANQLLRLLLPRLKHCWNEDVAKLKKELRRFDCNKNAWTEKITR